MGKAKKFSDAPTGKSYTKLDIVRAITQDVQEKSSIRQSTVKEVVNSVFDYLTEALAAKGRIELRGFGVFEVRHLAGRTVRNPHTSEPVDFEPRNVVRFKASDKIEKRVADFQVAPKKNKDK